MNPFTETNPSRKDRDCVVSLSGGQDSTTCLWWAKREFRKVHAVTFDYGQRHIMELDAARNVAALAGVTTHEVVRIGEGVLKGTSPLIDRTASVDHYESSKALPGGIEKTFVPARNILFSVILANRAACLGVEDVVMGICQEDYGGYPDCRASFAAAMEVAIQHGVWGDEGETRTRFTLHAPLMFLSKKQTVELARDLGPAAWDSLAWTHTCYDGEYPPNPKNHASLLRARGFHDAGLPDPLIQRAIREHRVPLGYPEDGLLEGVL